MNKFVCIHAHFYQPPRENAWLEEVERQNSAYPFHDWNERITTECYAPNTAARMLGDDGKITEIINNYSRISFNFGPTLLSWIEKHEPDVYEAIIEADRVSRDRFSGHGSAMAQVYNHIIMPLANRRDKETQIIWGIEDFRHRFGREPEGMWLAETAVDLETLELLAEHNIGFTILAPNQAHRIRPLEKEKKETDEAEENGEAEDDWIDVSGGKIDPRRAYVCQLPSGKKISLFFYDGSVSQDIAFGDLLQNGARFAERLISTLDPEAENPRLCHIATDGETYGHHQNHGDMALAYCLKSIEADESVGITIYPEYLDNNPPEYEVEIHENSSWSCVHGVERWRSNCGCNTGGHPDWNQNWRAPLRNALDWLRDDLIQIFEEHSKDLLKDPWDARNDYIKVIRDRSDEKINWFIKEHAVKELDEENKVRLLELMEIQRHALLMYTSCAWFFDEISGIETVQVIQYAARAMQLAKKVTGMDLEPAFINILKLAPSNLNVMEHGGKIYNEYIKPAILDLERIGAHYAVISLFESEEDPGSVYCFQVDEKDSNKIASGRQTLFYGDLEIQSNITKEKIEAHFAVLHMGEQNIVAGTRKAPNEKEAKEFEKDIAEAFQAGDISPGLSLMEKYFGDQRHTLRHLLRDAQRRILGQLVEDNLTEIDFIFRRQFQHNFALIKTMHEINMPIPKSLSMTIDYTCNLDLQNALQADKLDINRVRNAIDQIKNFKASPDKITLGFLASWKITELVIILQDNLYDLSLIRELSALLEGVHSIDLPLNLWKAQNIFFSIIKDKYYETLESKNQEIDNFELWQRLIINIGSWLQVGVNNENT